MLSTRQQSDLQAAVSSHLGGKWDAAGAIYERLVQTSPGDFQVNHLLGTLRQQQGRPQEALRFLTQARSLNRRSAPTLMCLGVVLDSLGRHDEAGEALRQSIELNPKAHEPWLNLGAHLILRGRLAEAEAAFRRAVKIKPDYARGWTGLGSALHLAGRSGEAISCHTRAIELDPRQSVAHFARAEALQACHAVEESLKDFDAHLALRPDHHEARSFRLFVLNYRDDLSREALFAEHRAYARAVEAAHEPSVTRRWPNRPDPGRPLRVAFLSPDLRAHSVAFFIEPILEHLDRRQFEAVLYHDHFVVDAVSNRLRGLASAWRHVAGWGANAVEEAIRADAPDILVDLAGHTGFNRMGLFARRLAPVQATYLGYPNTTGLRAMDYRLTDPVADPPGEAEAIHSEKLVRFASTAWAYAPPANSPEPLSDGRGRPAVFGSFNALAKLNGATLRLWREILSAVPGSVLVLKSASDALPGWTRHLAEAGFQDGQVQRLPAAPSIAAHLGAYGGIDVALDPFPYNGTTTTCEALWMGVPVITLAGDRHAGRVGASLLTAVGRPEWIANSPAEYVRLAAGLASDASRRNAPRGDLRDAMRRSALLDHAGQAARFAAALRQMWVSWCRGAAAQPARQPEHFTKHEVSHAK